MNKTFELSAKPETIRNFRKDLRQLLEEAGWQRKSLEEIVLASDEALTNVARHAYEDEEGVVKFSFEDFPDRTEISIEDYGKKFDPTQVPTPELPRHQPGGLGIHFIRTIMDEFVYDQEFKDGNRLRMIKRKTNTLKKEGEV